VSDIQELHGDFSLSLDQGTGTLVATIRDDQEQLVRCRDVERLSLEKWHHVSVTSDGEKLVLYRDGQPVSSIACSAMSTFPATRLWIGTAADGRGLWEGRIDQLALFDKTLSPVQIKALYEAAPQR
jgi:hypothetical protein